MRRLYKINICVVLQAPWLVHGNDPGRYGLDAVVLRDHLSRPVLPGTLIAGRVSAAWAELRKDFGAAGLLPEPSRWFGSVANGDYSPNQARLLVDDLVLDTPERSLADGPGILNRIKQDDDLARIFHQRHAA